MENKTSLLSCLASKVRNIDGPIKGKDGKPMKAMRNVHFEVAHADSMQSDSSQSGHDGTNTEEDRLLYVCSLSIQKISNDISILGADVAIPIEVVNEVISRFHNTLYGYFIGNAMHLLFENIVKAHLEKNMDSRGHDA
ncbi:hypothetical protein Tco_0641404 [Tanacetum coccineum]